MSVPDMYDTPTACLDQRDLKMLVVDGDEMILGLFEAMFPQSAQVASSAPEALSMIEQEPFDLVLVDYRMPGMDGHDLAHTIKERFADVPVVVMTGFTGQFSLGEAMAAGAVDYIPKPVPQDESCPHGPTQQDILSRLRQVLHRTDLADDDVVRQARDVIQELESHTPASTPQA